MEKEKVKPETKAKCKEIIKMIILFMALSIFACQPYLNDMMIYTHDFGYHLNRIIQISDNLKEGIFPSFIHSGLLKNLGYANSIFYPEIFLYIPAFMMFVLRNLHVLNAYKLFLIIITFFTFISTYISAKGIFKKKEIAYLASVLYGFSLYRLTDVYVRGALGEILSFIFIPLIFYGLYEILFGENKKWWIISIALWGIANSHVLTFVLLLPVIVLICLLNIDKLFKDKSRLKNIVIAAVVSVILCIGFFGPMLEQKANDKFYIDGESIESSEVLAERATSLSMALGSKMKFGYAVSSTLRNDGMSEGIGAVLLILGMLIFVRKDISYKENRFEIQMFVIAAVIYFMTTSLFPWKSISFLNVIQFPFRLNFIPTILLTLVGASNFYYIIKEENRRDICILFIIGLLIANGYVLSNVKLNFNPDIYQKFEDLIEGIDHETGSSEYLPVNSDVDDLELYNINDKDKTIDFERNRSTIWFDYENEEDDLEINIPLIYYKGYQAKIVDKDNNETKLIVEKNEENGHVLVRSDEKLTGTITVYYKATVVQIISYTIGLTSFIVLIIYIIDKEKKEKNK